MKLLEKWDTKFNKVSVQRSLQNRLKDKLSKNAVDKKRGGNKKES